MNDSPTSPTMESTVEKGVQRFEEAEVRASKTRDAILKLPAIFTTANGLGMMGYLQTQRMVADAEHAAGLVAEARAILFRLHREATDIAINHGVDIITTAGGGGGR